MKITPKVILLFILFTSCEKKYEAPVPKLTWDLFESPNAIKLGKSTVTALEGIYNISSGSDFFGTQVAVKSSYLINGNDTSYYISFFCGGDMSWIICEGKSLDSTILLYGYWRKMINVETGLARLKIETTNGARQLLTGAPTTSIVIDGIFGNDENLPEYRLIMTYDRPLRKRDFQILAHRCGGRTSDHLNVSENSVEMIRFSERLGATGVEMDVRITTDNIPIIYHNNTLNDRLIQPNGLIGPIESYSYTQLNDLVRLINGERIPTLRQALDAVLYQTNLSFVWLDTKFSGDLDQLRSMQNEYLQLAAAKGRNLQIMIGIPEDVQLDAMRRLNDHLNVPSICELSRDDVREINAKVWAPRWTLGIQNSEVSGVHSEGRKVFTWTLDQPEYIDQFISQGQFDGILSNYPNVVAYYEYTK